MERRIRCRRAVGLPATIAGLAAVAAVLPGASGAQPQPGYQSPDGSQCYDVNVDCGYGVIETAVFPAIQANAWLIFNGGKAKVSPDTVGIPKP